MHLITFYHAYVSRTVAVLAGITTLAVFLYGALLLGAVAHAAGRTAAEREVKALASSVSALEGQYLSQTKAISPERAAAMGFVAPVSIATVFAAAGSLTLR